MWLGSYVDDGKAMFDDREAMFDDREAMFVDRKAIWCWLGSYVCVMGWVPMNCLVTAMSR